MITADERRLIASIEGADRRERYLSTSILAENTFTGEQNEET